MSANDISNQTLTHILYTGDMDYLSLKFFDGSISPQTGNYNKTPDKEVAIPEQSQIGYIIFKTWEISSNFYLYSIELQSVKKEQICLVVPNDHSIYHYQTHEVSLKTAERIVAARIEVNKHEDIRIYPCLI